MSDSDDDSDQSDLNIGAAQGNPQAGRNVNGKMNAITDEHGSKSRVLKKMEELLNQNHEVLIFSSQKIQNLNDLERLVHEPISLQKIDISRNYLDNIDILNIIPSLKHVVACDNYIQDVNLQLPYLQELDLRNNFITKMPNLSQTPLLKILILNANNISDFKLITRKENGLNLNKIVLRNNKIDFQTEQQVNVFIRKLRELKALRILNIENNPFEKNQEHSKMIINGLPLNLELYNNQKKVYLKTAEQTQKDRAFIFQQEDLDAAIENQDQHRQGNDGDDANVSRQNQSTIEENKENTASRMPTLRHLVYNLEAANSHPNRAIEFLKQLYVDAERVKFVQKHRNQVVFEKSFTGQDDDATIQENIETFMQHAQLLIDSNFELRGILLSILSKLTIIRSHGFGVKCFNCLRDLMIAGKSLEQQVMECLSSNVIVEINELNPNEIELQILHGLKELVESNQSHETNLMTNLFESFFPKWLHEIKLQFLRQKGKSTAARQEDSEQTDAIFALLTAALKNDEINVNKMYEQQLHQLVAEIFLKTNSQKSCYIYLIQCMNEIAKLHSVAASSFINKFIHREIIQEIKLTLYPYKKSHELQSIGLYKIFSAQIELIASLLNAEYEHREAILKEVTVNELLQILTINNVDPILLTSVCYLAHQMLNCDSIKNNPELLADKINRLQSCEHLLPYLGLDKYPELMRNTQKYLDLDENQQENIIVQMNILNEPIIHRLFIAIIKLVYFFCKELAVLVRIEKAKANASDEKIKRLKSLLEKVSQKLDAAQRENALFNCLQIPNDDVKLAVVNCLYFVPIEQIDAEEMESLLKSLGPQNVGTGKTELVLAVIFNILSNIISDNSQKASDTTNLFKNKYSQQAINLSLRILAINQAREVDDSEEEYEKYTLSLSILNFLKHVTKEGKTRAYLEDQGDMLLNILYSEQEYTVSSEFIEVPVEVEATQLGRDFEKLRDAIVQGQETIQPYNYVSFRILHQMANLLSKPHSEVTYEPENLGDNHLDLIIGAYRKNLQIKIQYEQKLWEFESNLLENNEFVDLDEVFEQKKHHKIFTKNNGVKGILHFLHSQRNDVENWLRSNSDPAINNAGSRERHKYLGRGLKYKIMHYKLKEEERLRNELSTLSNRKAAQNSQSHKAMLQTLKDEDFASGFEVNETEIYLNTMKAQSENLALKLHLEGKQKLSIQDPLMRSLCIAAFLRCLYASIENAPSKEYHYQAIGNLSGDMMFSKITQLCASTNWQMANIGSKYLQIMRYIMRMEPTERLETASNLTKYEIISIVIRRILGLLKEDIKSMKLAENDQQLLSHLSAMSHQLVVQCTLFELQKQSKSYHYGDTEPAADRKLRYSLTDFILGEMFPFEQVQILVDLLFMEMFNAQQRLHGIVKEEEATSVRVMMGSGTLEHTKQFLMTYLAYCPKNKYLVLQYIMKNMIFMGRNMRQGFLEEILEGTNQIQSSEFHLRQMCRDDAFRDSEAIEARSLAYMEREKLESQLQTAESGSEERAMIKWLLDQMKKNCSLGERILFSQSMNVHVMHTEARDHIRSDYKVMTVTLTNLGVYIIDDEDSSFNQNPEDRQRMQDEADEDDDVEEELEYYGPEKVERFCYSQIKQISRSFRVDQRIVIEVQKQIANTGGQEARGGLAGNLMTERDTGRQNTNMVTTTTARGDSPKPETRRRKQSKVKQFYVTLVVPNIIDSVKLSEIFNEVVNFDQGGDEDNFQSRIVDRLLNAAIMQKIYEFKTQYMPSKSRINWKHVNKNNCQFCYKPFEANSHDDNPRYCNCNYHIVYAYRMRDDKALKICQNSKQRGGASRLLSTDLNMHLGHGSSTQRLKPEFGLLLISSKEIFFLRETPENWRDLTGLSFASIQERAFHQQTLHTEESKGNSPRANYGGLIGLQACTELVTFGHGDSDRIDMQQISSLRVINQRIPTLELEQYKVEPEKRGKTVWFSMMSDYNLQDTLSQFKKLKKQGSRRGHAMDSD